MTEYKEFKYSQKDVEALLKELEEEFVKDLKSISERLYWLPHIIKKWEKRSK